MNTKTSNRINELFESNSKDVLSVYYTAGFPELGDTLKIAQYLEEAGADIIEIGMPFSDPVADGPTIQESSKKALDNGMSLRILFDQLADLRKKVSIPVILMGYINPVLQFGISKFCAECERCGVDGVIIPDLPMAEYLALYENIFLEHGLKNVFLITPQTSESRIRLIDKHTNSFIYMVSSASVTGARDLLGNQQRKYFERVQNMQLKNPLLIGFGISNNETFKAASSYSNGAIIGSAFIKLLQTATNLKEQIKTFVKDIKA
ncbi:tryptophan synthase subunit alpha [Fulvivirga sp. 29W222]|uniref:Tryptophan synthase alpha chain n=1 Tax=Fulvivirga marina TaxID=2494733 RepID=A0A937G2I6_9BACT|nr:tryptophan synthase subunit alpha [Fulvivirga marina]MBL6449472.1 tryptophan synthase subunit alpha [Fulvivirga marina]